MNIEASKIKKPFKTVECFEDSAGVLHRSKNDYIANEMYLTLFNDSDKLTDEDQKPTRELENMNIIGSILIKKDEILDLLQNYDNNEIKS